MKGLIFAAGLGTRLKPLTDRIPKALVEVGGVPMLERVIAKMRDSGITDIVVNACYLKEKIVSYLDGHDLGVRVSLSLENGPDPLETGGGIRHAAGLLRTAEGNGRILIHNADILSDLDLGWLAGVDSEDSLATLVLREAEADRYLLFDDDMRLAGWTNVKTGEVKSPYPDFNPDAFRRYSFCGIHVLSEKALDMMEEWPDRFGVIDFYLKNAAARTIRGVVAKNLRLIDIGSPETLAQAERLYSSTI